MLKGIFFIFTGLLIFIAGIRAFMHEENPDAYDRVSQVGFLFGALGLIVIGILFLVGWF